MENHANNDALPENDIQMADGGEKNETPSAYDTQGGTDQPQLEAELGRLKDELADMKDKYLRLYSDFENFRRRTARERLELIQSANESTLKQMLPVLDDFERAEKSFQNSNSKDLEGLQLISNKFRKILEQNGVKPMELAVGSDFNPEFHEAISQVPASSEELKGKVVEVVEKGYLLNDKIIRHAKVVIGN
ncbi:MAG: nucleotide exchange factor GrpE [Cyclobacteriaceae bacterium]|nr:nucleotide exchange factor GrpE [Cyclobacteriaceae bacterium]MCX7636362.1 nucleotide exchange factor GrpE [Cyclobacteriaceae bacterium]MDW8330281.1 nucleotide exchange factor GrpE [Cyclobacteriaceae bacterium]